MGGLPRVSGRGNEPSEATAAEFQPSAAAPPPPSPPPSSPRANEPPASDNGSFSPKLQPDDYKPSGSAAPSSEAGSAGDEAATGRVGSGSAAAAGVSHYEASRDIITRLEFLRTAEVKGIIRAVRAAVVVGLVMLAVALAVKIDKPGNHYLLNNTIPILNICFASVLLPALLACWAIFGWRVVRSNQSGKRWSHRRRRVVMLAGTELTLQLVNCVFYLIPNGYVLTRTCQWYHPLVLWSGFVRWSIWSSLFLLYWVQADNLSAGSGRWRRYVTGRSDPAKMDAPLWVHWPKLVLWATHMTLLLALTIVVKAGHGPGFEWDPLQPDCRSQAWSCSFSPAAIVLLSLNTACLAVYWLAWTWCIARSFAILRRLPYSAMRMGNLVTRLQVRLRGPPILFFLLCVICLTFVKINTCSSYMISWLGYLPMQVVASSVAVANAYITMPKRPNQASILQVWLQEFAWTEADGPRKHSERSSSLPPESYEGFCLDCEPIYCMETAIKMMHWCFLAYDIAERPDSPFTADTACRLYDLEHFEVFWEKSLDTKAVVGWNSDTVVIAFRGTTSLANVRADIQVWRTRFPPDVGSVLLCSAPLVHRGFLTAYTANNFNERLLGRLEKILYRCALDHREEAEERGGEEKPVQVYVTGHSLGGALAQLCAYDVKKRCPCAEYMVHVKCYAFGAPRVGNHSWAKEYNTAIPDTWCLINKDDVVTTAGKARIWEHGELFFMYSRTGHKVLLNKLGDIIVRPNYVETAFRWAPGGGSIRDHLLTSYQKALSAVVAAQFGTKSVRQGREGALSLAQQQGAIRDVLERSVLTAREVEVLQTQGWDAYQRLLRQRARLLRASRRRRSGSQELQEVVVEAAVKQEQAAAAAAAAQPAMPGAQTKIVAAGETTELIPAAAAAAVAAAAPPPPARPPAAAVAPAASSAMTAAGAAAATTAAEEAVDLQPGQEVVDERGGVLHTATCLRSRGSGSPCSTICQLLHRVSVPAMLPVRAAQPAAQQQPQQSQLQAIAEEEQAESPFAVPPATPPATLPATPQALPPPPQHLGFKGRLAALVSRDLLPSPPFVPLERSLSGSSLASMGSSGVPPSPPANPRGSMRDGPAFPLVLDWGVCAHSEGSMRAEQLGSCSSSGDSGANPS